MYKIVIVEDDEPIRSMYKMSLENHGFDVRVAIDGREGLSVIKEHDPHLVLLDLRMPVMSGQRMLGLLRQEAWGANIRVVVLTNISKTEAPKELQFLGVDRYIVKVHTTPVEVIQMIKDLLGIKEKQSKTQINKS